MRSEAAGSCPRMESAPPGLPAFLPLASAGPLIHIHHHQRSRCMSATIEGVHVENPTAVWMQLKNTRHNVLKDKDRWNPGGWFEQQGTSRTNPFTMCLANAVRWVARGTAKEPGAFGYETDGDLETAERIILVAIPKAMHYS